MNEAILSISVVIGFIIFLIIFLRLISKQIEKGSGIHSQKFERVIDKLDKKLQ